MKPLPRRPGAARAADVLTRAVVRAAGALGLTQKSLAATLGISEASASRLTRGRAIDPRTKEGDLAALFLRVFRSLDSLVGGDATQARTWMAAHNHHLGAPPAGLIVTVTGLIRVADYLDALRGKS